MTVCAICGHVGDLVRNEALGISWCVDAWPCLMRADGLRRDPVGVGGQLRIEGVR